MTNARNEDGFALIEVIVSAAVLAIVALAVLSGIDGANYSSARERSRATAGALAEQDQERMRSIKFDKLASAGAPRTLKIDNVNYTITSKATWITDDANAMPACGDSSTKQAEYLKIVSTVTSNLVGVRTAPVTIESMVAPSVNYAQGHGTLAVKVVSGTPDRAAGLTVTTVPTAGGTTQTAVTNSEGCALFRSIAVGDYTVRLDTAGYIDKSRSQLSETNATVSPNFVNLITMPYDRPTTMRVAVTTLRPSTTMSTNATRFPSKADAVSDNASNSSSGVPQTFAKTNGSSFTTIDTGNIFPFENAYQYFTGDCAYESPVKANTLNTSFFTDAATKAASMLGDPAAFQPQGVTAFQPALNLRVRADYDTIAPSPANTFDATAAKITVFVSHQRGGGTDTCNDITTRQMALKDWPAAGSTPDWGAAPVAGKNWVVQNSTDFDPGMPFGKYTVCLLDTSPNPDRYWSSTYDNTRPGGQPSTVEVPTTGTKQTGWSTTSCKTSLTG